MSAITTPKDKKSSVDNSLPESEEPPPVAKVSSATGTRATPDSCRETLRINLEEQAFHHHLTLGLQEKLQKNRMIRNIKSQFRKPVDKQTLSYWERKNGVVLPTDLKEYYQSTNGFRLTWSLEHAGDVLPIGELNINPLNQLVEIHQAAKQHSTNNGSGNNGRITGSQVSTSSSSSTLLRPKTCSADNSSRQNSSGSSSASNPFRKLDDNSSSNAGVAPFTELEQTLIGVTGQAKSPISGLIYNPSNKTFILDSGRSGWGKVCLVYSSPPSSSSSSSTVKTQEEPKSPSSKPSPQTPNKQTAAKSSCPSTASNAVEPYVEIWFMDPSFQWHYLAPTFTHFYRMLLFHLGLPQWQYRFTPFGLSSWAEQMFWLVAPHLLQPPKLSKFPSMYHGEGLWCTDVPNEAATPNPTMNVLTNQLFRRKKKDKDKP